MGSRLQWRAAYGWPQPGVNERLHGNVIATAEGLAAALNDIALDQSAVFIAVGPSMDPDVWQAILGDEVSGDALVRDAIVDAFLVDVDAIPEASTLLRIVSAPTTPALPSAHVFHHCDHAGQPALEKRAEKELHAPIDLVSLLCFAPVFGLAHLHRTLLKEQTNGRESGAHTAYVIVYSGATWCPPCCRVMPAVPTMIRALAADMKSKGIHIAFAKADRDASSSIDAVYDVKLIPTFQIFSANEVTSAHCTDAAIMGLPVRNPLADCEEGDADPTDGVWGEQLAAAQAVALKPIAALQNSQVALVQAFLERHTTPLAFDDEF